MREGRSLPILYAPTDPRDVSLAGRGIRRVGGVLFIATGSFLTLLGPWLLIGGLLGWMEVDAFHPHQGWVKSLPPPREMPTLK